MLDCEVKGAAWLRTFHPAGKLVVNSAVEWRTRLESAEATWGYREEASERSEHWDYCEQSPKVPFPSHFTMMTQITNDWFVFTITYHHDAELLRRGGVLRQIPFATPASHREPAVLKSPSQSSGRGVNHRGRCLLPEHGRSVVANDA